MIIISKPIQLREYITSDGANLFREWLDSRTDKDRAKIQARLFRIEQGNLGDFRSLSSGLFELKFSFSGGLRVYFGYQSQQIIILLAAGNKRTQSKDILKAKNLWKEYLKGLD